MTTHAEAVQAREEFTRAAVAQGHRAVDMDELTALWDELRERGECWNGMTHHYLCERYGDRLYHQMGVGWFVKP